MIQTGDGTRHVVNHESDEPCFACPCCALWSRNVDGIAGAMRAHDAEGHEVAALWPECLVCQVLAGAVDG